MVHRHRDACGLETYGWNDVISLHTPYTHPIMTLIRPLNNLLTYGDDVTRPPRAVQRTNNLIVVVDVHPPR